MKNSKIEFEWKSNVWRRYIGKSNEWLDNGRIYFGNYLIFDKATLVFVNAKQKTFQTLTKNWEEL